MVRQDRVIAGTYKKTRRKARCMMVRVRNTGESARHGERKQKAVCFRATLEDVLARLDRAVMLRATLSAMSTRPDLIDYLGQDRESTERVFGKFEVYDFDINLLKRGRFVFLNNGPDKRRAILHICVSNVNQETSEVALVSKRVIESNEMNINRGNSLITNIKCKKLLDAFKKDIKEEMKELEWNPAEIVEGRIIKLKDKFPQQIIRCVSVLGEEKSIPDNEIVSTHIEYMCYNFDTSVIALNAQNTSIIMETTTKIPSGVYFEEPLTYIDKSVKSREEVNKCPSTFVAMFQYEASGGDKKTSIKRYFSNNFQPGREVMRWKVFCGRYFDFDDEMEDQQSSISSDASSQNSFSVAYYDNPSRTPSLQSRTNPVPEDDTLSLIDSASRVESTVSNTSMQAVYNDILVPGEDTMLSNTRLQVFSGRHTRIFINIFIIFQHWARHDCKKLGADKALWDPDLKYTGFDSFYPSTLKRTHLRPWMFTVTQALRDWIASLIESKIEETDENDGEYHIRNHAFDSDTTILNSIQLQIRIAHGEITNMFKEDFMGFDKSNQEYVWEGLASVDPIYAARDMNNDSTHTDLKKRAEEILNSAAKKAFPNAEYLDAEGLDFKKLEILIEYVMENLTFMLGYNPGSWRSPRTATKRGREFRSLSELAIQNLVGTFIKTDSKEYATIRSFKHTPILFPDLLQRGDVLAIYNDEGCTICEFSVLRNQGTNMENELQMLGESKGVDAVMKQRKYGRFSMKHRHICFKLRDTDDSEELFIENYTQAYILTRRQDQTSAAP